MSAFPEALWQSVAELSGLLLSEEDQETTLRRVADLAVRSIPGCDAVGVTILNDGVPSTRAATGGLVYEVDNHQYDIGQGPCLQAVEDRRAYDVEDMATSPRWERFCRHAAERGIRSSLSLPLVVRGEALGALNLYSRRPRAFAADDRDTALMFAAQAVVVLANAQTYGAGVGLAEQLRAALGSRAVIDQALGAIMAQAHCDADQAFDRLKTASQHSHRKLRAVAEAVVTAARRGQALPLSPDSDHRARRARESGRDEDDFALAPRLARPVDG